MPTQHFDCGNAACVAQFAEALNFRHYPIELVTAQLFVMADAITYTVLLLRRSFLS